MEPTLVSVVGVNAEQKPFDQRVFDIDDIGVKPLGTSCEGTVQTVGVLLIDVSGGHAHTKWHLSFDEEFDEGGEVCGQGFLLVDHGTGCVDDPEQVGWTWLELGECLAMIEVVDLETVSEVAG